MQKKIAMYLKMQILCNLKTVVNNYEIMEENGRELLEKLIYFGCYLCAQYRYNLSLAEIPKEDKPQCM